MITKRSVVWLCLCAIVALVVAGCAPAAAPPAAEDAAGETASGEEKITLTIWDTGTEYYQWVEDVAIPLFKEMHPNVEIVHTGIPYDQYSLKVDTAATAGDLPDLLADEVPGPNSKWYRAGLFVPLNDYMAADGIQDTDFCGLINTSIQMDDQVFMLPMYVNFWGMLYNKEKFAEAGLPILDTGTITTFDEWLDYARKLNKPSESFDTRVWGTQMIRPDWNLMPAGMSDPYYLGPDGRICAGNADTPAMIGAWENIRDAFQEDLTPETGQALLGDQDSWLFFTEGKVAISYGDMSMANQAADKGIDVGITGQPVLEKDFPMNVHTYGMGYGITRASKHPELAWDFIKLTATRIPLELIGAKEYGEATAGIPCYQPIAAEYIEKSDNPFLEDAQALIARYNAPPFTPDFYAGSTPIWEEFNVRVLENGEEVAAVIQESMDACQDAVDDMWEQYDSLR
jgi:ABC-type glycerol-3-phosphate transport system substrate-binding protein